MSDNKKIKNDLEKPLNQTPEWEQWRKEGALAREEQQVKETEAELLAAYDDSSEEPEGGKRSNDLDKELADDWTHLRRIAITKFPEGAALTGLTPKNRLVAIAHCLGWSSAKIAKASGLSESTVRRWISKRTDIKVFIEEFNLRTGDKDIVKTEWASLEYNGVQFVKSLLADKDTSDAVRRLKMDATKWIFERSRGKPGQELEVKGDGLRQMLEMMQKMHKTVQISEEEEDDLFETN